MVSIRTHSAFHVTKYALLRIYTFVATLILQEQNEIVMQKYWKKICNFGINKEMEQEDLERFRLLNLASFFWATFALSMWIWSIPLGNLYISATALAGFFVTLVPPFLSYFGKKSLSKISFVGIYTAACLIIPLFFGPKSLFEWGILVIPSSAYLLSNKKRPNWYFVVFGFVLISSVFLIYENVSPLAGEFIEIRAYPYVFTLSMCAFVFFMVATFKKELARKMKIILKQNKELSSSQEIIQHQNSELLLANQALDRQQIKLEKLNHELKQFASLASHDMKEPLRTISAFSKILSRKMGDDVGNRELFHFIEDAAKRMNELLEGLLEYAHAGQEAKPPEEVDLNSILQQVRLNYFQKIETRGAEIDAAPLPIIVAHKAFCLQLFQNLIGNAIKYTAPERNPKLQISCTLDADFIHISFTDNGIGIAKADLQAIFKPFTRLHSASEFEGSGIGLATCQRIVMNYDGKLSVESVVGQGSCFIVRLPITMLVDKTKDIRTKRLRPLSHPVSELV